MAIVDFTTMAEGEVYRGEREIKRCPRCGENGEPRRSTLGAVVYTHTAEVKEGGLLPIDSCRIEADDTDFPK